jgi:cytochrome c556
MASAKDVALGFLIIATLSACAKDGSEPEPAAQPIISAVGGDVSPLDDRTPVLVDAETRAAVLREMRTMLNAVQGIVWGAVQGDTAAVRFAATSAGLAAASEAEEGVAAQLGPAFVQLGMRTHASFDSLAANVRQGQSRDVVLKSLSTVMGNCVGCHNQFRIVVKP